MKKLKYPLILVFIVVVGASIYFMKNKEPIKEPAFPESLEIQDLPLNKEVLEGEAIQINLEEGVDLVSYGYDFELVEKEKVDKINATDLIYSLHVMHKSEKAGDFEIVVREIDNGDKFVFSRFHRTSNQSSTIPIKIVFENQKEYEYLQFEEEIEQEHDRVFGIDYTTNVKGLYTIGSNYDLYLSQDYISKELREEYKNGEYSVLRELVNEDKYIEIKNEESDLVYNLELRTTENDQISENWFILSKERLFSTKEAAKQYKKQTNHSFLSSPKWQTATGNYSKLPWSVEPGTKLGYGRNPVVLQGKIYMNYYKQHPERFYYSNIVNSVNYLWDYKKDTKLWKTEYTSTWLKREYGIIAPYTDTRHNENIALFLNEAGKILENQQLIDSYLLYAEFLSTQEEIGNILETENGYYVLDYYSEVQTKKTHVSLNHALGEMSYLFNAYKQTQNEKYLNIALKIKNAVEDTGEKWINETNGDLWYQINGDYSFEGKDYDTLTLEDIVRSLKYYDEFNLPYGDIYKKMMDSKLNFIIENNVELSKELYKDLVNLGYEEVLSKYDNVYSY